MAEQAMAEQAAVTADKETAFAGLEPDDVFVVGDLATLRLLAHPLRLRILEALRDRPRTVKELAASSASSPPARSPASPRSATASPPTASPSTAPSSPPAPRPATTPSSSSSHSSSTRPEPSSARASATAWPTRPAARTSAAADWCSGATGGA